MKRAVELPRYSDVKPFAVPDGVVTVTIDPESGMLANTVCPTQTPEVFIAGTEPVGTCPLHGGKGDQTTVSGWELPPTPQRPQPQTSLQTGPPGQDGKSEAAGLAAAQNPPAEPPRKKGFFGRLKDVFK